MSLKEIEKLKEKVDKDPNSKLFVPLAEEYRKEGMLDDAVEVLLKGLEKQPGYASARVALGKIYLEKGMMDEARTEFETVVTSVPDNLFAQKKLAEIYRDTGERDLAIKAYRAIVKLNPMDEESLNSLRDIEAVQAQPQSEPEPEAEAPKPPEPAFRMPQEGSAPAEQPAEPFADFTVDAAPEAPAPVLDEDLHAFKESLFGGAGGQDAEAVSLDTDEEEGESARETDESVQPDETIEIEDLPDEEPDISFAELNEAVPGVTAADEAEGPADLLTLDEDMEAITEIEDAVGGEDVFASGVSQTATVQDGDRMVADGNYAGAARVYQTLLSASPDDRSLLQRIEELRALLKLLGKDKEMLIARLGGFLDGVQKRRDEFYRRS